VRAQLQEEQGRVLQQTEQGVLLDLGLTLLLEALLQLPAQGQGQWGVLVWLLSQVWQGLQGGCWRSWGSACRRGCAGACSQCGDAAGHSPGRPELPD